MRSEDPADKMLVGKCPICGVVIDDEVDYRFPNPCECNRCGSELERVTTATQAEVNAVVQQ